MTFDSDGYPTEESLKTISGWSDFSSNGYAEWIEYIKELWYWPDFIWVDESENLMVRELNEILLRGSSVLKISTGGWSGNESIISAMRENIMWSFNFLSHRNGGHYELKLPKEEL